MTTNSNIKNTESEKEIKTEHYREEYIACPVCGHTCRKPGSICPYCSNYLFDADREDENKY